jgi:hypothetical protein
MSKRHPSPIEERWRWHWRRTRQLNTFRAELFAGPLRGTTALRSALVDLELVVQDEAEFFAHRQAEH